MVSIAAGFSVRNLPSMAVEGWSLVFWYVAGTALFLAPLALTAAELASAWPKAGGVYDWVAEAFGERTGFMAVWSIFVQNLPWYPTVLAFVAVTLAYGFVPSLQENRLYVACTMVALFWVVTVIGLRGPVAVAKFTAVGTLIGSVVPAALLIAGAAAWLAAGKSPALPPPTAMRLIPSFELAKLPFVSSLLLAFTGLEVSGYYALAVRDPQRNFPRAMLLALAGIAGLSIFATLAIALVVPADRISLSGGVLQAFTAFCDAFGVHWLVPVLAVLTALGAVALMQAWLIGPLIGLTSIARAGLLPPIFRRLSARRIPVAVLVWQAVLITIIGAAFALVPSVNQAYWILSATVTALLGFYYLPIFAAVIRLRYTQPDTPRPFRIPGGKPAVWCIGGVGLVSTTFAVAIALQRPDNVTFVPAGIYIGLMVVLALIWMLPWAVFVMVRRAAWRVGDMPGCACIHISGCRDRRDTRENASPLTMRTADPSVETCDCEPFVYMPAWWSSFLFRVVSPRQLAVYTYIAMLGVKEGISTPTVRQIQDDMGLASDTTVYDALRALEDAGLIRRVRVRNDAGLAQNGYHRPACESTLIALLDQKRIDYRLHPVADNAADVQSEAVTELAMDGLKTLLGDDFARYAAAPPDARRQVLLDLLRASLARRRRANNEQCVCNRGEADETPASPT